MISTTGFTIQAGVLNIPDSTPCEIITNPAQQTIPTLTISQLKTGTAVFFPETLYKGSYTVTVRTQGGTPISSEPSNTFNIPSATKVTSASDIKFTTSGTFIPTTAMTVNVKVTGGGGGGADGWDGISGGGGGGGGTVVKDNLALVVGGIYTITIGSGGRNGFGGKATSFLSYVNGTLEENMRGLGGGGGDITMGGSGGTGLPASYTVLNGGTGGSGNGDGASVSNGSAGSAGGVGGNIGSGVGAGGGGGGGVDGGTGGIGGSNDASNGNGGDALPNSGAGGGGGRESISGGNGGSGVVRIVII
jgi:hypothetical protein